MDNDEYSLLQVSISSCGHVRFDFFMNPCSSANGQNLHTRVTFLLSFAHPGGSPLSMDIVMYIIERMARVFDGKRVAQDRLMELEKRVNKLVLEGVRPTMVVFLVGRNRASWLYVDVKRRAAEGVNCEIKVSKFTEEVSVAELVDAILDANENEFVHGVMVQLPLPGRIALSTEKVIGAIDPGKDVDGLREDSGVVHPTARAVYLIFEGSGGGERVCVVGARGAVGGSIQRYFESQGVEVVGLDKDDDLGVGLGDFDVVISATGQPGLIVGDMVKDGVGLIDVGSPKADFDESALKKASFYTPVPGGVGPMTVACLMENLVSLAEKKNPSG